MMRNSQPPLDDWKITAKKLVIKDKYLRLFKYTTINPLGKRGYFWVAKGKSDFAVIIPLLNDQTTLLIGQYRPAVEKIMWEFPMGAVNNQKDMAQTALTELREETGYIPQKLVKLGELYPAAGLLNQKGHVYLAREISFVGSAPEGNEYLETKKVTFPQLEEMINKGEVDCAITIAAYYLFKSKNQ